MPSKERVYHARVGGRIIEAALCIGCFIRLTREYRLPSTSDLSGVLVYHWGGIAIRFHMLLIKGVSRLGVCLPAWSRASFFYLRCCEFEDVSPCLFDSVDLLG